MSSKLSALSFAGGGLACPNPDAECQDLSSDGASEQEIEDEANLAAEDLAREQRKRAGIPELELDAIPSSIAGRMLLLDGCLIWNQLGVNKN